MPKKLEERRDKLLKDYQTAFYLENGCETTEVQLALIKGGFNTCASELLPVIARMKEALEFYGDMRFNREKMEWMPSGPDKAKNILSWLSEQGFE